MEMTKPEIKEKNEEVPKSLDDFLTVRPYVAPSWASHLNPIPDHFCSLGRFPTPIHKWNLPNLPNNTEVWLKRDDLAGMQLSGNKVRKLEFFIADALKQGADCVITIGGIQSNHCRATAVAAKYFNLDSYLILFTSKALLNQDPGFTGNLLIERLVGAHIELVTREEYQENGSEAMTDYLKSKLVAEGRKPYVIPVGGSNSLGIWGYVEAIREIEQQLHGKMKFDDIVVAGGSGGTLDGLSVGSWLSTLKAKIHAFSIYYEDPENYFHDFVQRSLDEFHVNVDSHHIIEVHNVSLCGPLVELIYELIYHIPYFILLFCSLNFNNSKTTGTVIFLSLFSPFFNTLDPSFNISYNAMIHKAKGLDYAMNTSEELNFIREVAESTGVILDPVYSGKAAYGMMKEMTESPRKWEGRKILFIHTGGLLGMYGKVDDMGSVISEKWRRMDINEPTSN